MKYSIATLLIATMAFAETNSVNTSTWKRYGESKFTFSAPSDLQQVEDHSIYIDTAPWRLTNQYLQIHCLYDNTGEYTDGSWPRSQPDYVIVSGRTGEVRRLHVGPQSIFSHSNCLQITFRNVEKSLILGPIKLSIAISYDGTDQEAVVRQIFESVTFPALSGTTNANQ